MGRRGPQPDPTSQRSRGRPRKRITVFMCQGCNDFCFGRPDQKYCGAECRSVFHYRKRAGQPRFAPCGYCGNLFQVGRKIRFCSKTCDLKTAYKRDNLLKKMVHKERKGIIKAGEKIDPCEVFARDAWRCQICGKKVQMDAPLYHPLYPTIDHILPIACGGTHTMANVQCAHFSCNSRKHARRGAQMRLF